MAFHADFLVRAYYGYSEALSRQCICVQNYICIQKVPNYLSLQKQTMQLRGGMGHRAGQKPRCHH